MFSTKDTDTYAIRFIDFLKQPKTTGAIGDYGEHSIHNGLKDIDRKNTHTILEIGPAKGATTSYILTHKTPESFYECCEINEEFCTVLKERFGEQFRVHHQDFLTWWSTKASYDLIISGVPMSLLTPQAQHAMLTKTYALLAPWGTYVHIQYSHALTKQVEQIFWNAEYSYCLFDFPFTCAIIGKKD